MFRQVSSEPCVEKYPEKFLCYRCLEQMLRYNPLVCIVILLLWDSELHTDGSSQMRRVQTVPLRNGVPSAVGVISITHLNIKECLQNAVVSTLA